MGDRSIQFASILLRILASMFISNIGLKIYFFVISLSGIGIRVSLNKLGSVPSSAVFWKSFRRVDVKFSKRWMEFACDAI